MLSYSGSVTRYLHLGSLPPSSFLRVNTVRTSVLKDDLPQPLRKPGRELLVVRLETGILNVAASQNRVLGGGDLKEEQGGAVPLSESFPLLDEKQHAAVERLDEGVLHLLNLLFAVLPVGTVHRCSTALVLGPVVSFSVTLLRLLLVG